MLKIYYTIEAILNESYSNHSKPFRDGFSTCLKLLWIGFSKREDFNKNIRIHQLEMENKDLKKALATKYTKISDLERDLGKHSLISGKPTQLFREFEISTLLGSFLIVTNMDSDTVNSCVINFATTHTFNSLVEGKSKLLQFINLKTAHGFKAYKDKNVAVKEGAKMI